MATTAPVIRSGTPGSFAWGVFHERHPELVRRVLAALPYGPVERAGVEQLLVESTVGVLEPLAVGAHDAAQWGAWGEGLWGRPWGEAPFLWAESYFYRRLLEATGYFGAGVWRGVDPFGPFKAAELRGAGVEEELAALKTVGGLSAAALLGSALWGNRADLSFRITAEAGGGRSEVLVDESAVLWAELERRRGGLVCLVADNAGQELLPDLVLMDELLAQGLAGRVVLYVKPQPYFVSDATMDDVLATVERLRSAEVEAAREVGRRLWQAMERGVLEVRTHPFFCAPLPYREMPADLRAEFAGAAMTVLKGDLNYRRLVGDQWWPPTTPFGETVDHFPSSVAALRTLKSDVVVGLDERSVARLDGSGEPWRTSGRHAVVQVNLRA
ncbi:damage-control phosphatase ARMT1 family protein [Kitasatospora sp. NPDC058965]|uniref:damage-control phosphatase ARMT1 family protein n=1 Tax=Kitasatospora sp. NPDC058965 TaxID=3346682 RepID=UPI0036A89FCD